MCRTPRRCGDERAGAEDEHLVVGDELGLALQDVERVDVVVVHVRVRPVKSGSRAKLDDRELLAAHLDRREQRLARQRLALAGLDHDGVVGRLPAARLRVDAVEAALLAAVAGAQVVREAAVRRMEVQEAGRHRRAEAVDDARRRADAPARADDDLLVVDEDPHLALEDVEGVGVVLVVVRVGPGPRRPEVGLRDAELLEGRLQHDAAAEQRFALPGAVNDPWHGRSMPGRARETSYAGVSTSAGASARIIAAASADTACLAIRW